MADLLNLDSLLPTPYTAPAVGGTTLRGGKCNGGSTTNGGECYMNGGTTSGGSCTLEGNAP